MAINFSELLTAERLRPLWGEGGAREPEPAPAPLQPRRRRRKRRTQGGEAGAEGELLDEVKDELGEELEEQAEEQLEELLSGGEEASEEASEEELAAAAEAAQTPPAPESPTQVLDRLEEALRLALGPRVALLQIYLQPLRLLLARLEGGAPPAPHPLHYALQTGDVPTLLYRLEDSVRGLQLMAPRSGR